MAGSGWRSLRQEPISKLPLPGERVEVRRMSLSCNTHSKASKPRRIVPPQPNLLPKEKELITLSTLLRQPLRLRMARSGPRAMRSVWPCRPCRVLSARPAFARRLHRSTRLAPCVGFLERAQTSCLAPISAMRRTWVPARALVAVRAEAALGRQLCSSAGHARAVHGRRK